uniref:YD repeat (Two copies) n=1 Tax=Prevotella sp. GTC17259 TaxID=3236795 RepID=A0AB33J6G9_9BACT
MKEKFIIQANMRYRFLAAKCRYGINVLALGLLSAFIPCMAQDIPEVSVKRDVIPPSPRARTFQVYGNIPVDYSTGVPHIEIPLYTLTYGNISVPITLKYHTHNVQPFKAEDSNSGLGWVVECGGSINRSIVGQPDEASGIIEPGKEYNENQESDYHELNFGDERCDAFDLTLPNGTAASFFLECKGENGSFSDRFNFHLTPNIEAKIVTDSDLENFTITDNKGIIYEFGGKYKEFMSDPSVPACGWKLHKITDPQTNRSVLFTYTSASQKGYSLGSFHSILYDEAPGAPVYDGVEDLKLQYWALHPEGDPCTHYPPSGVEYLEMCMGAKKNDCVIEDIYCYPYSIEEIQTVTAGYETMSFIANDGVIEKIRITRGAKLVREISFQMESLTGRVPVKLLKSVIIKGSDNTTPEVYQFEYDREKWVNYSSDYWGFYTGRYSTRDGMCTQKRKIYYTPLSASGGYTFDYEGFYEAPRQIELGTVEFEADPGGCKANLLTKVIYPTKGYTILEYESGQYLSILKKTEYGGGPRIKRMTDVSGEGQSVTRQFSYSTASLADDPANINLYLKRRMNLHFINTMGYYRTWQTVISNQPFWGADINVHYPVVDIHYESEKGSYKERYIYDYDKPKRHLYNVTSTGEPFISELFVNPQYGKLKKKILYNADNKVVQNETYVYDTTRRTVINNRFVSSQLASHVDFHIIRSIRKSHPNFLPSRIYEYYDCKVHISNLRLAEKTITSYLGNDSVSIQEKYSYTGDSDFRIATKSAIQSDKSTKTVNYKYIDASTNAAMFQKNMINNVQEVYSQHNSNCQWVKNEYDRNGLLSRIYTAQGKGTPLYKLRIENSYDIRGNVTSSGKSGDYPTCYLWGYDNMLPVAKIEGMEYAQLLLRLGAAFISSIGKSSDNTVLSQYLTKVRLLIPTSLVTTFLYDPALKQPIQTYDPSMRETVYLYDGLGRLISIKGPDNRILERYNYHYQH